MLNGPLYELLLAAGSNKATIRKRCLPTPDTQNNGSSKEEDGKESNANSHQLQWSRAQLRRHVRELRRQLEEYGVGLHSRVAICFTNQVSSPSPPKKEGTTTNASSSSSSRRSNNSSNSTLTPSHPLKREGVRSHKSVDPPWQLARSRLRYVHMAGGVPRVISCSYLLWRHCSAAQPQLHPRRVHIPSGGWMRPAAAAREGRGGYRHLAAAAECSAGS